MSVSDLVFRSGKRNRTDDLILRSIEDALQGENPVLEIHLLSKTGRRIPCEVRLVKLPSSTHDLIRASITDISIRKKAEMDLVRSREQLQKQNRKLLELAGSNLLEGAEIGNVFEEITRSAAETLEVDRASVWYFEEDRTILACKKLFIVKGQRYESGKEIDVIRYPGYFKAMEEERTIVILKYP